jgi:ATP-binding cassette, subfamily C, bacterial CydD
VKPLDPRLLRYARSTRAYLGVTVLLGSLSAGLIVAQATLLASGITQAFLSHSDISPIVVGLIAVVAGRALVAWGQEVASARASAGVKSELRNRLALVLARRPGGDTGAMVTLVTRGLDALDSYFSRYLPQLVLAGLVPAIILARIVGADLIATVTIVLTLPLIPLFMALVGLHTEAANRRQFARLSRLAHHFLDVVAGLPTLKVFGRAGHQTAIIRKVSDQQRRITMRTLRTAFLSSLVLELLATLSVALVAVGIGLRLVQGELDLETALLLLVLAPEAYQPLRQVGANYHASAEGLAAASAAFEVLETPLPSSGSAVYAGGDLVFSDVVVSYPAREPIHLDFRVPAGSVTALTGPSGCGKSTALGVLLGFVPVSSGRVTAGSVDLSSLDLDAWRRNIAYVPQRPQLFAGTVRSNVDLLGTAPDDRVLDALASAGFADASLDTVLSDDGAGLSAGQRQRIAVARAFLKDAPVVLLDEPTANLDLATADQVMAPLRRLACGRTVLIAAHRPELIALADRVIRLEPARAGAL